MNAFKLSNLAFRIQQLFPRVTSLQTAPLGNPQFPIVFANGKGYYIYRLIPQQITIGKESKALTLLLNPQGLGLSNTKVIHSHYTINKREGGNNVNH